MSVCLSVSVCLQILNKVVTVFAVLCSEVEEHCAKVREDRLPRSQLTKGLLRVGYTPRARLLSDLATEA